jgi:hypothetical protein
MLLSMRAVINLEGAFALVVLLSTIGRYATGRTASNNGLPLDGNAQRKEWLLLLLVLPAALLWTLTIPLVSDDFVRIAAALRFAPDKITAVFVVPENDHFFRPLGYISLAIDALWAGRNPVLWHLAALLIHFANCFLVYLVARQTGLARFFATAAAVIFGIHGSRPEAVTWIAARFDLIATLFVLATLALFMRGRYVTALATALLALISKESAYVLPVLLMIVTNRTQWRRATPFAALTSAVFLYRWHVVSGIGGYQTAANTPAILNFSLLRTANALLLRLWATLFFPINWTAVPQWWLWIALGLGLAGYAVVALLGGPQRRTLAFLLFTLVAALPVQHLLLIGADLEKSRVLYLPSVGFALFLAAALETLREPKWRVPAAIAILVFQTASLEHNLAIWRGVAQIVEKTCDSVAASLAGNTRTVTVLDLPNVLRGVYFLHEGMPYCLEVAHEIDNRRVREDNADFRLRWDPRSETLKEAGEMRPP